MENRCTSLPKGKIGCDLVYLPRIQDEDGLAKAILSEGEMSLYSSSPKKREFLGGRFAAKEAFLKAWGKGLSGAPMKEVEVVLDEDGQPSILFQGERHPLSISHDGDYAMAVVLL